MTENTRLAIGKAEELFCNPKDSWASKYGKVIGNTSENVSSLLNQLLPSLHSCITVLGSGQQMCELISHGAKEVLAFDLNVLETFHWNLTKTSYLMTGAEATLDYFIYDEEEATPLSTKHFQKLEASLDCESREFWQHFYRRYEPKEIAEKLFSNVALDYTKAYEIRSSVSKSLSYLHPDQFPNFSKKLESANLQICSSDLFDLPAILQKTNPVDFMYLSNIFSYCDRTPEECLKFVTHELAPFLHSDGLIQCDYLNFYGAMQYDMDCQVRANHSDYRGDHEYQMYEYALQEKNLKLVPLSVGWLPYHTSTAVVYQKVK